jgi:hypothetical protein
MDLAFDDMVSFGLIEDGAIKKNFRCSNDFITQKVYFPRLMRVYVEL